MFSFIIVMAFFSTPTQTYHRGFQIQPRPSDWYQTTEAKRNHRQIQFGPTFEDFSRQIQFQDSDEESNNVRPSGARDWSHTVYDDDFFVWDEVEDSGEVTTPRTTVEVPGMGTTQSACEDQCLTTQQYNPACGSNGRTYHNFQRLKCAQRCGKAVTMVHLGTCQS